VRGGRTKETKEIVPLRGQIKVGYVQHRFLIFLFIGEHKKTRAKREGGDDKYVIVQGQAEEHRKTKRPKQVVHVFEVAVKTI